MKPLNGVDYKAREEIIALILEEADENRTMVISTHLIEEVESFIEDAIFIKDGQLVDVVNVETDENDNGKFTCRALSAEDVRREYRWEN